jgi:hypothetical protein
MNQYIPANLIFIPSAKPKGENMLPGLSEGRIVHYVLKESDLSERHKYSAGRHRPAIVVNSWPGLNRDDGYSNLLVFLDGSNDEETVKYSEILGGNHPAEYSAQFILWATSRSMSENMEPGTWHWPERIKSVLRTSDAENNDSNLRKDSDA